MLCIQIQTIRPLPLYASAHRGRKHIANLLLLDDGDKRHYITVRNLSALLKGRNSRTNRSFPCPYYLCCFTTAAVKHAHMEECGKHGLQSLRYPTPENSTLKFSNTQNEMALPYVIYSDFESYLAPNDSASGGNATQILDTHTPSGLYCLTVSSFPHLNDAKPFVYSGPDVMQHFFLHIKSKQNKINKILATNKPMKPFTQQQRLELILYNMPVLLYSFDISKQSSTPLSHDR
jgi:hypothetical protein